MGKLNSFIKFVVFNANALLCLGGAGIVIVASILLAADFIKLAKTYMQIRGIFALLVGVFVAAMSVIGCVGTHRQIQRDRLWSGRRVLSLYQLILVAVVIGHGFVQMTLYSIEVSLDEAVSEMPEEHGDFEGRFRKGFNEAYFNQLCSASGGGDTWVWSLVEANCPGAISRDTCSCPDIDGSGLAISCSLAETYNAQDCCPDEEFCESGQEEACPYAACRTGILEGLLDYITPARKYSTFVFVLEGLVLVLTCLLICYNPRDSAEDILIKTGLIRGQYHLPGVGGEGGEETASQADDLEGGTKHLMGTSGDAFKLDMVQPVVAARKAGATVGGATGSPPVLTPSLTPMAADTPTEPLRQFMTPRSSADRIVNICSGSSDKHAFEYHNPRRTRSILGSSRLLSQTGAATAAAATADTARAGRSGGSRAAATITVSAASAGVVAGGTSPRRRGEEKRSQDIYDDDSQNEESSCGGDEEKNGMDNHIVGGIRAIPQTVSLQSGDKNGDTNFYHQLSAQTPFAEYGTDCFEAGGATAAQRGAPDLSKSSIRERSPFFADSSSSQEAPTPPSSQHPAGEDRVQTLPPQTSTPPMGSAGDNKNGNAERPSRPRNQVLTTTSPMAVISPPARSLSEEREPKVHTSSPRGDEDERGVGVPSHGTPPRFHSFSVQTPIGSPLGRLPPTYLEHVEMPGPIGSATVVRSPSNEGVEGTPGWDPAGGDPANPKSAEDKASPTNPTTFTDTDSQKHEEGEMGNPSSSSTPGPIGGASAIPPGQGRHQRRGSASSLQSRNDDSSSLVPNEARSRAASRPDEPPPQSPAPPFPVKSTPEHVPRAVGNDLHSISSQTPVVSPQRLAPLLDESISSSGTVPTTATTAVANDAEVGGAGVEEGPPTPSGGSAIVSPRRVTAEEGVPAPALVVDDEAEA